MLHKDVKMLIGIHCEVVPQKASNYARNETKINYFFNPELGLLTLRWLFLEFYSTATGRASNCIMYPTHGNISRSTLDSVSSCQEGTCASRATKLISVLKTLWNIQCIEKM